MTSAVSAENTDSELRSLLFNHQGTTRYGLLSQTLDYGVTHQMTASVTEVYAKAFESNPYNPAEGRVGFRSPRFQLSAWTPLQAQWMLKSSVGLQLNPSSSSSLNYALVAGDVTFQPTPNQVLAVGLTYTDHKLIGSHSHAWRSEWGTSMGIYQLRLKYAQEHLAKSEGALGRINPSTYSSWQIDLGRPLAPGFWGQVSYAAERHRLTWTQAPLPMPVVNQRHVQRLTAALKWTWD